MKALKNALLLFLFLGIARTMTAQDVILKKDNTTILSKVLEITTTEIKYKKWSNQEGPTYSISRSLVTSINFQNGEVERFIENTNNQPDKIMINPNAYSKPVTQNSNSNNSYQNVTKLQSPYSRGKEVQFSLHVGAAIPIGKFGISDNNTLCAPLSFGINEFQIGNGGAKTGFSASMGFHVPLLIQDNSIVGIIIKDHVLYNSFSDHEKQKCRALWDGTAFSLNEQYGVNAYYYQVTKNSEYVNFSILGGIDYTYYVSKTFGLFADAGIGLNIAAITKTKLNNLHGGTLIFTDYNNHIQYYSADGAEISYKTKPTFAYELGVGLFLFDQLSLGIHFSGCTPYQVSPKIKEYSYTYEGLGNGDDVTAPKLQVSLLSLQLGYHF